MLLLSSLPSAAPQAEAPLPKVASASVPFYPRLAPTARIQGTVTLRVSTDGKRVSAVEAESGPPMLVQAAKENVKTWQFESHTPTNFEITFHYRLLLPSKCDSDCHCDSTKKETVLLQLPTNVDVSAKIPVICDPAVEIRHKN
jgi:TonB family protein